MSDELYEKLRRILEAEGARTYTIEEVREIGDDLIEFFTVLAEPDPDNNADEA